MFTPSRCPFEEGCRPQDPCPHPDACAWYVQSCPGGHCAARDSDEVLLRYQLAMGLEESEKPNA
jgi:hypothetical protein